MKFAIILFAVIATALAQDPGVLTTSVSMTQKPSVQGSTCTKTPDCGEGLCCVTSFLGKKKRMIFDGLFGNHNSGKCQPERQENESCHVFMIHDIFNPNLFEDYCPCMAGLECRGETVDETGGSITHHNPKCQPKSAPTNP